jgi:ubiquinol-cytochrome c reductase cytochrome b subunit
MFSAILAIMLLPITDLGRSKGLQFRPLSKIAFFIFVANFLVLMQLGAKHVESPFIEFGQISTILYFAHFVFIVPFVSLLENTLIDLNTFKVSIFKPSLGKVSKGKRYLHVTKSLSVY